MNRRQVFGSLVASVAALSASAARRPAMDSAAAAVELEALDIGPMIATVDADVPYLLDDVELFDASVVPADGGVPTMTVKLSIDTAELEQVTAKFEAMAAALDDRCAELLAERFARLDGV